MTRLARTIFLPSEHREQHTQTGWLIWQRQLVLKCQIPLPSHLTKNPKHSEVISKCPILALFPSLAQTSLHSDDKRQHQRGQVELGNICQVTLRILVLNVVLKTVSLCCTSILTWRNYLSTQLCKHLRKCPDKE